MFSFLFKLILLFFFFISTLFADSHILEQENFEAWQYTCVSEQNQKICDLRELVFDSNTNEVVSYLSITINPDVGKAVASFKIIVVAVSFIAPFNSADNSNVDIATPPTVDLTA